MNLIKEIARDNVRLLTFRPIRPNLRGHYSAYLFFGLLFTWLAGVGRYWDNPRASLLQHLGIGSVIYVFSLALVLWAIAAPLKPRNWSYKNVLLFITLTSPPAVLYAIPVERFMSMELAQAANAWFLAVVATWRVALLFVFLRKAAGLSWLAMTTAALLPLTLIVTSLSLLNLEHVVFDLMAGIGESQKSANDTAYFVVLAITVCSYLLLPLLLGVYGWLWYSAMTRGQLSSSSGGNPV